MKKAFITLLSVLFLSMPAYGWEMYVSNGSADAITVYNQTGALIKTITHPSINQPCQSAFRNNGKLYVACAGSSKIVIIDETDNVIGAINSSYRPSGLAFGRNNHLYVGVENPNLQGFTEEYDESDNFVKSFQTDTILFKPNAMTIGLNDNLLVADNYNCQVVAFDFNGNVINQFSTGSKSWPRGIAIGPDSFIYVAGDGMNNVSVFDPNILARTITGVTAPYGITFDPENHHLFVANFGANNILEYLYTGELIGVFASGLSHPNHIAFKPSISNTTTTTTISTTTTTTQTPVPFEANFNWSNSFQIYGWQPVPQVDGFDYYFSPEKIDTSFAGHKIRVDFIEVTAPGTSLGDVTNFDIEVHLNGSDITLPEGQFLKTHDDPVSEYTRNAQVQYDPIIGGPNGSYSYTFSATYDFILGTGSAYPALNGITRAINSEMNITDGLHVQLFFWTGDNRNCKIQFSGATLKVKGVILDTPTTTTTTNPDPCLVAYYPFDGNANDESGNGLTGTVYGATLTSDRFGNANSAYDFDGEDDYIQINDLSIDSLPLTLIAWVKPDLRYDYNMGIAYGDSVYPNDVISGDNQGFYGHGFGLNYLSNLDKYEFQIESHNAHNLINYFEYSPSYFYYVAVVYDFNGIKSYFGSIASPPVFISTLNQDDVLDGNKSYTLIGRHNFDPGWDTRNFFKGIIDEMRIYNCALSEAEIQQLYIQTPTLINLASFTASPKAGRVILAWSTESEIDNAGFNLYRSESENGNYIKINTSLISAKGSPTQGASYEFIDTDVKNRRTYYYKLEDIDLNGTSTVHGPVSAMPKWIYGIKR